jgi:CRISPR/Cas system-associated exonuclease Cas4 (RecB family)
MTLDEHGASSVHRWALCPGSRRAERGKPDTSGDDAQEGTMLHACLAAGTRPDVLTAEQEIVLETVEQLREVALKTFMAQWEIADDEPCEQTREQAVFLHRGIKAILPGHYDLERYWPRLKVGVWLDYKTGRLEVEHAADNLQMRAYALMGAERKPIEAAGVAIISPRLQFKDRLTLAVYTPDDLAAARKELYAIIDATEAPDPPLRASEDACRYCRAKNDCPAAQSEITRMSALTIHEGFEPVDAATLADLLDRCGMADKMIGAIRAEAKQRLEADPQSVPGWGLKPGAKKQVITDMLALLERLELVYKVEPAQVVEKSSLTKTNLELIIRAASGLKGRGLQEAVKDALAGLVEEKQNAPSLVRAGAALEE